MARPVVRHLTRFLLSVLGLAVADAAELTDEDIITAHLKGILTTMSAKEVAANRDECIMGSKADTVAMAREVGLPGFADVSDLCVTVLIRTARDGRLLDAYAAIIAENHGDPSRLETLPDAIGGALLKQKSTDVPIGNGLAVGIKPALAFDAGFVVAYRSDDRDMSGLPEAGQLKQSAEACLAQQSKDMASCFWSGYALAARALNGHLPPISAK